MPAPISAAGTHAAFSCLVTRSCNPQGAGRSRRRGSPLQAWYPPGQVHGQHCVVAALILIHPAVGKDRQSTRAAVQAVDVRAEQGCRQPGGASPAGRDGAPVARAGRLGTAHTRCWGRARPLPEAVGPGQHGVQRLRVRQRVAGIGGAQRIAAGQGQGGGGGKRCGARLAGDGGEEGQGGKEGQGTVGKTCGAPLAASQLHRPASGACSCRRGPGRRGGRGLDGRGLRHASAALAPSTRLAEWQQQQQQQDQDSSSTPCRQGAREPAEALFGGAAQRRRRPSPALHRGDAAPQRPRPQRPRPSAAPHLATSGNSRKGAALPSSTSSWCCRAAASCCANSVGSGERRPAATAAPSGMESPSLPAVAAYLREERGQARACEGRARALGGAQGLQATAD